MDFLKVKNNFNFDFYTSRRIYGFYHNIYNRTSERDYINRPEEKLENKKKDIIVVNNIPAYLDARLKNNNSHKVYKVNYLDGFLVNLEKFKGLEDYMKIQFGAKSRSRLRGFVKRLEICFNIQYKMYYGEISKKEFHFLMDTLKKMISRRFLQRGQTHESLKDWNYYLNSTYDMILEKKASLFVIYDCNKPIDICLNYHHQNILLGKIKSYDIDYSKFRLGSIDIIKLLEWCFNNHYTILDFSYGDLNYKRTWCNSMYVYEHQIIYNYKKVVKQIFAYCIFQILKLKAFSKKKKVDILYHNIRSKIKSMTAKKQVHLNYSFKIENYSCNVLNKANIYPIDINKNEFAFLRKSIYDFQYLNFESTENLTVYKTRDSSTSYVIKGENKIILLTLISKETQQES